MKEEIAKWIWFFAFIVLGYMIGQTYKKDKDD